MPKTVLLIFGLILCLCVSCAVNPITGEEELMLISENDDLAIGKQYAPEVQKQLGGEIKNDTLQNYIDSVGQKIVKISHKPGWEYHFIAVDHNMVNAMALPGGYVFVTKGMLQKIETEAQLAGLLSHELVHIVARHSSAAISRQMSMSMLIAGAGIAADLPADASRFAGIALQLIDLKYSRDQERQADLFGMDYMVRAGYNPHGVVELIQMLQEMDKERPADFFSSHPSPENRILYLTVRAQSRYANLPELKTAREDYQKNVIDILKDYDPPKP